MPRVEQACADAVDQERKDAFLAACSATGLPAEHPVVQVLANDLTNIRPPDVWLRIIASHLTPAERETFPLKALDYGLSSLRLADAYANRQNADPEVTNRLLDAVALQMPYPSVERWRAWHNSRTSAPSNDEDVFTICRASGRYAPLSMVTVVSSAFGDWASRFTSLAEQVGSLEYCTAEIMYWRRGKARDAELSGRWVQTAPAIEERTGIEAALNLFAENVFDGWNSTKFCVSEEWMPLLDETVAAAIQLAVVAADWINANVEE